jgi:hypothetical protein
VDTVEIVDGQPFAAVPAEVGTGRVQWDRCLVRERYPHAEVAEVLDGPA